MEQRSTADVFLDHLQLAQEGRVEEDIARNYSSDCVLMTTYGTFRGRDGLRAAAALLHRQLGASSYTYRNKVWADELAFLEWTAETARGYVDDGADSFLIRNGRIVAMTAHYTVRTKGGRKKGTARAAAPG